VRCVGGRFPKIRIEPLRDPFVAGGNCASVLHLNVRAKCAEPIGKSHGNNTSFPGSVFASYA
jgi:hypothetical protein